MGRSQMPERNQKVFDRVRQELAKNTGLGSRDLYEIAKKVDENISGDTLQQFHARYVLPVRREDSRRAGGAPLPKQPSAACAGRRRATTRSRCARSE